MTENKEYLAQGIVLAALESIIEDAKFTLGKLNTMRRDDGLGRMITSFFYKQLDHAISVHKLSPSMDVVLITRTMIEGLMNLSWVMDNPDERVQDWFDYTAINNFELLSRKLEDGVLVSQTEKDDIETAYARVKDRFLQPNGKKHYENFRRGKSLRDIAENDDMLKSFYIGIYKYFSDWSHWGPQSLYHALIQTPDEISYYEDNHTYLIPAVIAARECLFRTITVANNHFNLGCEEMLNKNYQAHDVEIGKIL